MFQSLRQGNSLYILSKNGTPKLSVGTVTSISAPMPRYSPNVGMAMPILEQVVDISVETPDGRYDYKQIPAMSSVANFGDNNVILADSQQAMTNEVAAMRNTSQSVIASLDYHKQVVEACTAILDLLNPTLAKERERDNEIAMLRDQLNRMEKLLALTQSSEPKTETECQ